MRTASAGFVRLNLASGWSSGRASSIQFPDYFSIILSSDCDRIVATTIFVHKSTTLLKILNMDEKELKKLKVRRVLLRILTLLAVVERAWSNKLQYRHMWVLNSRVWASMLPL